MYLKPVEAVMVARTYFATSSAFRRPEYVSPLDFKYALRASHVHFSIGVASEVVAAREELEAAALGTYSAISHFKYIFAMLNPYCSIISV